MTIKTVQRDKCPVGWFIGQRTIMAGEVLELVEIKGDQYTWIDVRPAKPGESVTDVHREPSYMQAPEPSCGYQRAV